MTVSLTKGANVSLTKEAPGLKGIKIGCGWDVNATDGAAFDLDAMLFLLNEGGKTRNEKDFVFYGNKEGADGLVVHMGDNLTGEGEGDDEVIMVALDQLPADIDKIAVAVNIHMAVERSQNFGMVNNAYVRIVNAENEEEIAKYDLTEDYALETAVIFGEVYRKNGEWKFKAVGAGWKDGLPALCSNYGVPTA